MPSFASKQEVAPTVTIASTGQSAGSNWLKAALAAMRTCA